MANAQKFGWKDVSGRTVEVCVEPGFATVTIGQNRKRIEFGDVKAIHAWATGNDNLKSYLISFLLNDGQEVGLGLLYNHKSTPDNLNSFGRAAVACLQHVAAIHPDLHVDLAPSRRTRSYMTKLMGVLGVVGVVAMVLAGASIPQMLAALLVLAAATSVFVFFYWLKPYQKLDLHQLIGRLERDDLALTPVVEAGRV